MKYLIILAVVGLCIFGYKFTTNYEESSLRKTTEWGFEWNMDYVESVVKKLDSPSVEIDVDVLCGQASFNGAAIVAVDTLVVTVSGPRQEVRETLVTIDELIY